MIIETERLKLRPFVEADAARIAALAGDWDVARMTGRIPYPYSEEAALQWIQTHERDHPFGVEYGNEMIGCCGYTFAKDLASAEIGYWFGRPYWGRGFATEAAQAVMRHVVEELDIKRLTCGHIDDNPVSQRVIEKLGFRFVGRGTHRCAARDSEVDVLRYEWTADAQGTTLENKR